MKQSLIKEKSYSFALQIIGFYKELLKQNEFVLSKQLLRAGTNIGANVEEALVGQSRADFFVQDVNSLKRSKGDQLLAKTNSGQ